MSIGIAAGTAKRGSGPKGVGGSAGGIPQPSTPITARGRRTENLGCSRTSVFWRPARDRRAQTPRRRRGIARAESWRRCGMRPRSAMCRWLLALQGVTSTVGQICSTPTCTGRPTRVREACWGGCTSGISRMPLGSGRDMHVELLSRFWRLFHTWGLRVLLACSVPRAGASHGPFPHARQYTMMLCYCQGADRPTQGSSRTDEHRVRRSANVKPEKKTLEPESVVRRFHWKA
eukprot:3748810-Rhodomonas_salina.1